MKVRAIICDVYRTMLSVVPPSPEEAESRWRALYRRYWEREANQGWNELCRALEPVIRAEHESARGVGIAFPEVNWPETVQAVLPELGTLGTERRDEFLFEQAQIWHAVEPMAGVATALKHWREVGVMLGIASNAQPYTVRELTRALGKVGSALDWFEPELCFWSFAHGFSKPDPHVFRLLGARLGLRGIGPQEVLMIGDRMDNDIEPARAQGWMGWRLGARKVEEESMAGNWGQVLSWLQEAGAV